MLVALFVPDEYGHASGLSTEEMVWQWCLVWLEFHCHPNVLTCVCIHGCKSLSISVYSTDSQVPELLCDPAPHTGHPQCAGIRLEKCTWAVPCLELRQEQLELHQ